MTSTSVRFALILLFVVACEARQTFVQDRQLRLKDPEDRYVARFDNQSLCFIYYMTIPITRWAQSNLVSDNLAEGQATLPLTGGGESSDALPSTSDRSLPLSNLAGVSGDLTDPSHAEGPTTFINGSPNITGGMSSPQSIQGPALPIITFPSSAAMLPPGIPPEPSEQSDTGGLAPNAALTATDVATTAPPATFAEQSPNGIRPGTLSMVGGTDDSRSPAFVVSAGDSSTATHSSGNSLNPFVAGGPQTPDLIPVSSSNSIKLSADSVTKTAVLGTARTTSLRTTSQSAESRIILSVRQDNPTPAAATVTVTNGLQSTTTSAGLRRRQVQADNSTTGFVGDEDVPVPNSCSNARVFRKGVGTLQKQGVGQPLSVDPGVPFIDLANYSGGSIITDFDVINDTLVWSSGFFFEGKAGFCQVEGGSVYATFTSAGGPENCNNVSLVAYKGT